MSGYLPAPDGIGPQAVFDRYEQVRARLPSPQRAPVSTTDSGHTDPGIPAPPSRTDDGAGVVAAAAHLGSLSDAFDVFDAFILDSYGVLNVGPRPIAGARERIEALTRAGKRIVVLTNAATPSRAALRARFRALGFGFEDAQLVSSRDVLSLALRGFPASMRWAVIAPPESAIEELPATVFPFEDHDSIDAADGFVLLSTQAWTRALHDRLTEALARRPRPLLVGNPDLVAPQPDGLSLEPGWVAHELADALGIEPRFCGKPFGNAFELALAHLAGPDGTALDRRRVAMVGDSLHTDILGARAAGLGSVLVTGHGLMRSLDVAECIARSGIAPDYVLDSI